MRYALRASLIILACLLFIVGCSSDDGDSTPAPDTSNTPTDTNPGTDLSGVDNTILKDLEGKVFRFSYMEVQQPESVSSILNTIWKQDIEKEILNVIFYVESVDVDAGTLVARAGSGKKNGDNFEFMLENPQPPHQEISVATLNLTLAGLCFSMTDTDKLYFPSEVLPTPLEIENLIAEGCIRADLSGIDNGKLSGAIDQEKSKTTPVEFAGTSEPLYYYLDGANEVADADINGNPGYAFSGLFRADEITNFVSNL